MGPQIPMKVKLMKNGVVMHHIGNVPMVFGIFGINVKYLTGPQHMMMRPQLIAIQAVMAVVLANLAMSIEKIQCSEILVLFIIVSMVFGLKIGNMELDTTRDLDTTRTKLIVPMRRRSLEI